MVELRSVVQVVLVGLDLRVDQLLLDRVELRIDGLAFGPVASPLPVFFACSSIDLIWALRSRIFSTVSCVCERPSRIYASRSYCAWRSCGEVASRRIAAFTSTAASTRLSADRQPYLDRSPARPSEATCRPR